MVKITLLCLALALPFALLPQDTLADPPRSTKYSKYTVDNPPQRFESTNLERDSYKPSGVVETKPLMRVIPQRDGRFMLEPLSPTKKVDPSIRPTSRFDNNKNVDPAGRGYNLYEPWNFRELVISLARSYRGARYSRGASFHTTNASDCSGFVQYIYRGFKMDLPRSSGEQAQVGKIVTRNMDFSKLLPGDLLFFGHG